jgi:plasmid stabilization system protein ParE
MRVLYTEIALDEIEDILSYIAKDNASAALRVSAALSATVARLAEFPLMAVETDVPNVRMTLILPYRYVIFFSVGEDDSLIVRNVRHGRRQRPDFTKPL